MPRSSRTPLVLTLAFMICGAAAVAEDCYLDSVRDTCSENYLYLYYLAHDECEPVVYSSPWLPFTITSPNGYTTHQPTTRYCQFVRRIRVGQDCVNFEVINSESIGDQVGENSINCSGEYQP